MNTNDTSGDEMAEPGSYRGSETFRLPERFDRLLERVMEQDRAYFDRNPDSRRYTRVYVPGEIWPRLPEGNYLTTVYQAEPGKRVRYVHRSDVQPPDEAPLAQASAPGPEFRRLLRRRLADEERRKATL